MPEELYHHGVKGMKWGVRKQKYLAKVENNSKKRQIARNKRKTSLESRYKGKNKRSGIAIQTAGKFASGAVLSALAVKTMATQPTSMGKSVVGGLLAGSLGGMGVSNIVNAAYDADAMLFGKKTKK